MESETLNVDGKSNEESNYDDGYKSSLTINDLEDDELEQILSKLKGQDLLRTKLVCHRWYDIFYLPVLSNKFCVTLKQGRFSRKHETMKWLVNCRQVCRSIVLESIDFQGYTNERISKIWEPIAHNITSLRITTCHFTFDQFILILSSTCNLKALHLDKLTVLDEAYYDAKLDMDALKKLPLDLLENVTTFSFSYYLALTNDLFKFFVDRMPNIEHLYITRVVETPDEDADIKWHALFDFIKSRASKLKSLKIEGWSVKQESIRDMALLKDLKLRLLNIKVCYYDAKDDSIMNEFFKLQNKIQTLILHSWTVSDDNFRAICDNLSDLRVMDITNSYRLTSDGIVNMPKLTKLRSLSIFSDRVTYDGLRKALLLSQQRALESLDFTGSGDKFHFLESLTNLPSLRSLRLGCYNYKFTNEMLRAIIESLSEQCLIEELILTDAEITDDGLTGENCGGVSISRLKNLKILSLKYMEGVTDKSVGELSKLRKLEVLSLEKSQITDNGIKTLVKNLPVLLALDISNCKIGDSGLKAIIDNLKYLKILEFEYRHFERNQSQLMKDPKYKDKLEQLYGNLK